MDIFDRSRIGPYEIQSVEDGYMFVMNPKATHSPQKKGCVKLPTRAIGGLEDLTAEGLKRVTVGDFIEAMRVEDAVFDEYLGAIGQYETTTCDSTLFLLRRDHAFVMATADMDRICPTVNLAPDEKLAKAMYESDDGKNYLMLGIGPKKGKQPVVCVTDAVQPPRQDFQYML